MTSRDDILDRLAAGQLVGYMAVGDWQRRSVTVGLAPFSGTEAVTCLAWNSADDLVEAHTVELGGEYDHWPRYVGAARILCRQSPTLSALAEGPEPTPQAASMVLDGVVSAVQSVHLGLRISRAETGGLAVFAIHSGDSVSLSSHCDLASIAVTGGQ